MSGWFVAWGEIEAEPEVAPWLEEFDDEDFGRVEFAIDLLAERGVLLGEPHTRQLRGKLRELRINLGVQPDAVRITEFVVTGRRIVLLSVFKKQRRQERAEIERADAAMRRCVAEGHTAQEESDDCTAENKHPSALPDGNGSCVVDQQGKPDLAGLPPELPLLEEANGCAWIANQGYSVTAWLTSDVTPHDMAAGCEAAAIWLTTLQDYSYPGLDPGERNALRHFMYAGAIIYDAGRSGAYFALELHERNGNCRSAVASECERDEAADRYNNRLGISYGDVIRGRHGTRTKYQHGSDSYERGLLNDLLFTGMSLLRTALDTGGGCPSSPTGEC